MLRSGLAAVFILSLTSLTYGVPGQVVSYHLDHGTGTRDIVPTVPAGGLVITDIYFVANSAIDLILKQSDGQSEIPLFNMRNYIGFSGSFAAGIPCAPGSTLQVSPNNTTGYTYTIMGYIPGPASGNAPAVGTWGMIILGCIILIVGSRVIMQRKVAA